MHPTKDELSQYINKTLDEKRLQAISNHVCKCEFCQEYIGEYMVLSKGVDSKNKLSSEAEQLRDKLLNQAIKSNIIVLSKLITDHSEEPSVLAADGSTDSHDQNQIQNVTTLYSTDLEIILRLMRDLTKKEDYIQLISDNEEYISHVMVQVPDLNCQFITDIHGKAIVDGIDSAKIGELDWQIKLPDALFSLEPIVYDPEKVEYSKEIILETKKDDKIKVIFDGKTEGKQISIEILKLDGQEQFDNVKLTLIQDDEIEISDAVPQKKITFKLISDKAKIKLRLFHK